MIIPFYFEFPSGKVLGADPEALRPPSARGRGSVGVSLPNTLVHLGLQAVIAKPFTSPGGLRWVALGAVVPDLPWILQRVLRELPAVDLIALRSYCVVQSTLLLSLVLCGSLAFLSRRPRDAFALLASASALHLALDGLQHKWGNGVLLFASVSWELSDFGWLWPEHPLKLGMTLVGPAVFWWLWRREPLPRARRALVWSWQSVSASRTCSCPSRGGRRSPATTSTQPPRFKRKPAERVNPFSSIARDTARTRSAERAAAASSTGPGDVWKSNPADRTKAVQSRQRAASPTASVSCWTKCIDISPT